MRLGRNVHGIIPAWFLFLVITSHFASCGLVAATITPRSNLSETNLGPTISWYPEPIPILAIDGKYTGQKQEIYESRFWVNDSDGVDIVIFRFKWSNDEEWLNRTAVLIEGDEFLGRYKGNLTWSAPGGGIFQFKIFANDTFGYWNETSPMTITFGYMYWDPIYTPHFWILFVILPIVSLIVIAGVWKLRQKRRPS